MSNYFKISKNLIIAIISMFLLFFGSLVFILKYKVEESFSADIIVSNDRSEQVVISSENIYKIDYDSKLILLYNNKYNEYKIGFISKQNDKFIIDIEPVLPNTDKLIPGSHIRTKVVYSSDTILNIIFNYFK